MRAGKGQRDIVDRQPVGRLQQPVAGLQRLPAAIDHDLLEHHRRHAQGIAPGQFGVDQRQPLPGREHQLAITVLPPCRPGRAVDLAGRHAIAAVDDIHCQQRLAALVHGIELGPRHPEHALVAGQPQPTTAVIDDAEHLVARQAAAVVIHPQAATVQAQQPRVGGHPHRAVGIVQEIEDRMRRQLLARLPVLDPAIGPEHGHARFHADPDPALTVTAEHLHGVIAQAQRAAQRLDPAPGQPQQATRRAHQEAVVGGQQRAHHQRALRRISNRHPLQQLAAGIKAQHALFVGAGPDTIALRVQRQCSHRAAQLRIGHGQDRPGLPSLPALQASGMADPDGAIGSLQHAADVVVAQAIVLGQGACRARCQPEQPR